MNMATAYFDDPVDSVISKCSVRASNLRKWLQVRQILSYAATLLRIPTMALKVLFVRSVVRSSD